MAEIHVINIHETEAQWKCKAESDCTGYSPQGAFGGRWEVESPCADENDGVQDHDCTAVALGTE